MLIENPDAFKSWLTSVLEPLCDADPEALAKYVFALVKKDKAVDVLRQGMLEQLDVFLQAETKPFVELLFKTLETQDYITPTIPNTNPPNPNVPLVLKKATTSPTHTKPAEIVVKEMKPIIPVSTLPNLSESINGNLAKAKVADEPPATPQPSMMAIAKQRELRKSDSEKEDRIRSGRPRHRSASRNRSRSRSWERNKRSRSRERSPRVERPERRDRSRPWRNKSPPRGARYDRDRRRSRSGSPVPSGRIRSRSRSPRHSYRGGRYRNRSPPRSPTRSRSRSNDRSGRPEKDKKDSKLDGKDKEENSGGATPTQDSNHGDTDMRLTNTTQSIQSVVSALNPATAAPGTESFGSTKRRCRDFDEKGFCMRGEMCPYDHGIDPVVLEDTALSRVLTFGPNGAPTVVTVEGATSGGAPGTGAPPGLLHHPAAAAAVAMLAASVPGLHHGAPHHRGANALHPAEYNPSAPAMWHHRPGFRGGRGPPIIPGGPRVPLAAGVGGPFGPLPSMQRELISVPVTDNSHGGNANNFKRRANASDYQQQQQQQQHQINLSDQHQPPAKRKPGGFDFGRLGPRSGIGLISGNKNPCNCSLELKKVPRGLNNITHLNNHFSKFGKIVNIQVNYEGDPEGALITFSSHAEANAAYRSTEAVLNNRFIKVFWHSANGNERQENVPPSATMSNARPVKDRLGQPVNSNKVLNLVQPKAATDLNIQQQKEDDPLNSEKLQMNATGGIGATVYVPSALKKDGTTTIANSQAQIDSRALANAAIVKNQEILAAKEQLKKKHEEKRKEAMKITQDLRKRKQELLEKQLAQQKLLIEKLEKINPTGQQRELLMSTIKTVQESIESIRKDMMSTSIVPVTPPSATKQTAVRKSKEEAQREVLDAELDLITRQQEGGDTSELQRRLLELRAQAYTLTRGGSGGGGSAGGGAIRRGRGGIARRHHHNLVKNNLTLDNTRRTKQHTVVDHRPTRLLVSGYEADESDSVLAHFAQYGEIIDYVTDESTPSIILNYRTRKEAEVALLKGKHFQDRTLSVTWCNTAQLNSKRSTARTVLLNTSGDEQTTPPTADTTSTLIATDLETSVVPSNSEDQLLEGDDEQNVLSEPLGAELSEEALLQDDEEDDDENEDRSWRR